MNTSFAFSLALVLGSLTFTPQGFGQVLSGGPRINGVPLASESCPVQMNAQHERGLTAKVATDKAPPKGIGQQLHIALTNAKSEEITGIKITVHGSTGKGSLLSARAAEANSPEATKTFDLKLTVGAKEDASTDLWVSGLTAVTHIDLDTVTYADGSNWRSSALETCQFRPDRAMLISSR
jgi:hypothetical protein